MQKSDTIVKLAGALSKAQSEMKAVSFDSTNPFFKSKYMSLGALIEATRPVLAKNGLAVVQMPINDGERVGVETLLTHESGEWISSRIIVPMGDEKGKSLAQLAGSIITYLRRYSLGAFLNSYADEDTDGQQITPAAKQNAPSVTPATPKPAAEAPKTEVCVLESYSVKETPKGRAFLAKLRINGNEVVAGTMNPKLAQSFDTLAGSICEAELRKTERGHELLSIAPKQ